MRANLATDLAYLAERPETDEANYRHLSREALPRAAARSWRPKAALRAARETPGCG